jgi:hypothetical protein
VAPNVSTQVLLLADLVRLAHPGNEGVIDVLGLLEPKGVQVILRGKGLDLSEAWVIQAACEDDVAIEPFLPWCDLRERHSHLKRDAGLFGQDDDRADGLNCSGDAVVDRSNDRVAVCKVVFEVVQRAAGVRLVSIGEDALALRAAPEGVACGVSIRGGARHGPNVYKS